MDCYNEFCPLRVNPTSNRWHCASAVTCPNRCKSIRYRTSTGVWYLATSRTKESDNENNA